MTWSLQGAYHPVVTRRPRNLRALAVRRGATSESLSSSVAIEWSAESACMHAVAAPTEFDFVSRSLMPSVVPSRASGKS